MIIGRKKTYVLLADASSTPITHSASSHGLLTALSSSLSTPWSAKCSRWLRCWPCSCWALGEVKLCECFSALVASCANCRTQDTTHSRR